MAKPNMVAPLHSMFIAALPLIIHHLFTPVFMGCRVIEAILQANKSLIDNSFVIAARGGCFTIVVVDTHEGKSIGIP